jgi:hypothetical protein
VNGHKIGRVGTSISHVAYDDGASVRMWKGDSILFAQVFHLVCVDSSLCAG